MITASALHLLIPTYPLDQIIGYFTGTVSVGGSGGSPVTVTTSRTHGFGDSAYFQGTYSLDGGTTWNDFGADVPGGPVTQYFVCNANCDVTNINIIMRNTLAAAQSCIYKVYLLAKNTMVRPITPLPTNQILSFSSKFNFQEIAQKGSANLVVSTGNTGSVTIGHSLGYIPLVRAFVFLSSSPTTCRPISYSTGNPGADTGIDATQVRLTTTTVTFFADQSFFTSPGINASIEYRLYLK